MEPEERCRAVPQRYLISFMCLLCTINCITMRTCVSVAIDNIAPVIDKCVNGSDSLSHTIQKYACPKGVPSNIANFRLIIVSSFFIGYFITHFVGAYLAKNVSAKYTLGCTVLMSTILFIIALPAACASGLYILIIRFAMGLAQGPMFPAINELLSEWTPLSERTLLSSVIFAGVHVGSMVALSLFNYLLKRMAWMPVFCVLASINFVWIIVWTLFCFDKPRSHPYISSRELRYLKDRVPRTYKEMPTPWKSMLTSKPLWVLVVTHVGHDYSFYMTISSLPYFYSHFANFGNVKNGDIASLSFLAMWLSTVLFAYICNKLITIKCKETVTLRRILASLGGGIPGIGMVWASYMTDKVSIICAIIVSMSFMGAYYPGVKVNTLDLSPTHAAMIMAIVNGCGCLVCIFTPFIVKAIVTDVTSSMSCDHIMDQRRRDWQMVFWIMFAVLDVTNIPYLLSGSGDVQPWDRPHNQQPTVDYRGGVLTIVNRSENRITISAQE